uniref:Uncharacterized protein n=1 Tax=Siphoviridae sp. cteZR38 TaxID=2827906 RepID=A0A8S5SMX5_9CAUD|nr:MAG TPA: hypothetical protein [Siphoviridae sp. cteZR38]
MHPNNIILPYIIIIMSFIFFHKKDKIIKYFIPFNI